MKIDDIWHCSDPHCESNLINIDISNAEFIIFRGRGSDDESWRAWEYKKEEKRVNEVTRDKEKKECEGKWVEV